MLCLKLSWPDGKRIVKEERVRGEQKQTGQTQAKQAKSRTAKGKAGERKAGGSRAAKGRACENEAGARRAGESRTDERKAGETEQVKEEKKNMSGWYFYTEDMQVGYQGRTLIDGIRMELNRGEILTLIGPNGAGKSTILKSITKQLELLGGKVWIASRDMMRMSGRELSRMQAVVLTERMTPELMTCEEIVLTGRYPYTGHLGLTGEEDRKKAEEALRLVHALDLRDRDFNAISDGQRQRILLARALCQEPDLIVLDEPTSYLDIRHKLDFLILLRKMAREKQLAVILSLHELDLAQKISDRIMCVNGPRIDRCGTPEEIFDPAYICSLFGIDRGNYDALFGSVELPAPEGEIKTFVICGGGSGIPYFRSLQRDGIPFAAGILPENDIDYEAARLLATKTISCPAFEPPGEETVEAALQMIRECDRVICACRSFGTYNAFNRRLWEAAEK